MSLPSADNIEINTSGLGPNAVVPKEVQQWNWGAMVFGKFWFVMNGLASSAIWQEITGTGDYGPLGIYLFLYLGPHGNELAWRYKHWESVDAFLRTQNRWSRAAVSLLTVFTLVIIFLLGAAVIAVLKRPA